MRHLPTEHTFSPSSIFMSGTPSSLEKRDEVVVRESSLAAQLLMNSTSSLSLEEIGLLSPLSTIFVSLLVSSLFSRKCINHHECLGMESRGLQEVLVQLKSNSDTGFH